MTEDRERARRASRPGARLPRISDLFEATDEMIAFVEKYQKVWESEGRAMLALGEFLTARAESLRYQVELMRMGSDTFRRYTQWSEALLGLRPETFFQSWLSQMDRFRQRPPEEKQA